jgi:hypothetical protein
VVVVLAVKVSALDACNLGQIICHKSYAQSRKNKKKNQKDVGIITDKHRFNGGWLRPSVSTTRHIER